MERHPKRPVFKHDLFYKIKRPGYFSIAGAIRHLLIIAIVLGIYYFIRINDYFPLWSNTIYYAVRIIIALEIIIAAAYSLFVPLLALVLGALSLYYLQIIGTSIISFSDAWQLIIIGAIGVVLTFIVKSLRRL